MPKSKNVKNLYLALGALGLIIIGVLVVQTNGTLFQGNLKNIQNNPALPTDPSTSTVKITVNPQLVIHDQARLLLGMSFDGRTSSSIGPQKNPIGYYSPVDGSLLPGVASFWNSLNLTTLRYPGNAVMGLDWKQMVGALGSRKPLSFAPNAPVIFGFDEFMAMVKARGVPADQVQIMVNIYPTATSSDPISNNADWVEYANAPHNGSNPGGGTDWAAVRAGNGHPEPYGIKIWNIGNEPWSDNEFKMNPDAYLAVAVPIIDAMRAIDPTIKITLPAAGAPALSPARRAKMTAWDNRLITAPELKGKIFGLSQHLFYEDTIMNGGLPRSVKAAEGAIDLLTQQLSGSGIAHVIGDHAHSIQHSSNGAAMGNPDYAMQWQAAVTTSDFLLMLSNKSAIDRANFWIFGAPKATWHPIRQNPDGSYTLMPVGKIYEIFGKIWKDYGVSTQTLSPVGSDGNSYSVRSGAFESKDGKNLTVILVNRDPSVDHIAEVQGLNSYRLQNTRVLTGASANADTFNDSEVTQKENIRTFNLPHSSITIIDFILI